MTLRQHYAGPRPHAIAATQPARAAASAHAAPPGSAHRVSRARARSCRSNPASQAQAVPTAAVSPGTPPAAAGLPPAGPSPRGHAKPTTPAFPAAQARRGKRPPQSAPGTADACHRRPAPQPARLGPYPAGCFRRQRGLGRFLWVSCGCPAGRPVW
jgi:hypothetical protein